MSLAADLCEYDWQDRALCAQTDPEAFFPEKGGSTREAKRVCGSCEVRAECLGYALETDQRFGIWGGLSEQDRRRVKRTGVMPVFGPPAVPRAAPAAVPVDTCRKGHRRTPRDTYIRPDGRQDCRACKRDRDNASSHAGQQKEVAA